MSILNPTALAQQTANVGPVAGYTTNFNMQLTNFDWKTWHQYEWRNWEVVDSLLETAIGFLNLRGEWQQVTAYLAGETVLDPADLNVYWQCISSHTSTTDFVADQGSGYWQLRVNITTEVTSVFSRQGDIVAVVGDYDQFYALIGDAYTKAEADSAFIDVTGDTMTGNLTLPEAVADTQAPTFGQAKTDAAANDAIVTAAYIAADVVVTDAYVAADAVITGIADTDRATADTNSMGGTKTWSYMANAASATVYLNDTGGPIIVMFSLWNPNATSTQITVRTGPTGSVATYIGRTTLNQNDEHMFTITVPTDHYYYVGDSTSQLGAANTILRSIYS